MRMLQNNHSTRYTFVLNYKQKRGNQWVNNEVRLTRGSINNHWFLEADYVIDNLKKVVLKNRPHMLDDKNVLVSYEM